MRRQLSAAFREHLVDAYVDVTSLFLAMEANKTGRVLAPVSQYEGKLAVGTLYASKRVIDTDPNTVRAFVAGGIETIDFILTPKADDVGRAFRLMSATCSDPCRPAVPHSIRSAYSGCRDQRLPFNERLWHRTARLPRR